MEAAATDLRGRLAGNGVLAVKPGLVVEDGRLAGEAPCIVVAAHPARVDEVERRVAASWLGYRVQVRPASLQDQLGDTESLLSEAPAVIAYDDDARTGPDFSFDWIDEPMQLRCHVGPERSFVELERFFGAANGELVSSMYQFYVDHIRAAIEARLAATPPARMKIVLDPQTRELLPARRPLASSAAPRPSRAGPRGTASSASTFPRDRAGSFPRPTISRSRSTRRPPSGSPAATGQRPASH